MPPIAELITQQKNVTGDIKMLSIREHRFPFFLKLIIGTDSIKIVGEHLLKNVAIFLI